MKKTFFMNIIAIVMVMFFSFNSVFAASMKLPLDIMSATIEDHGHYKSLNSKNATISYTYDNDSIDFKYVVKSGETEKVYTTTFELKDDVYSYTYTGDKSDATQIKLNTVAFESVLYAVGELNALQRSFLEDMSKDYSRYNYDEYGIEVKTFTNSKGTVGIESFRLHTTEISAFGTSFRPIPEPKKETTEIVEAEPVPKGNEIKSIVLAAILLVVVVLIVVLAIKVKRTKVAKKATKKTSKKTK